MGRSGRLLLIASPTAATSRHVRHEVGWWLTHRPLEEIIILGSHDVITNAMTDALPPALAERLTREPKVVELPEVPKSGRIDPANPQWTEALADVVSALDGVDKDQLVGEHLTNRRRWHRIRNSGVALLALLLVAAIAAAAVAFVQLGVARHQQRVALGRLVLNEAQTALASDPQLALRLALAARQLDPSPENQAGLTRLVGATPYAGTLDGHTSPSPRPRSPPPGIRSPPRRTTGTSSCGTPPTRTGRAGSVRRSPPKRTRSSHWPSPRRAHCWPPPTTAEARSCGTCGTGPGPSRSANPWRTACASAGSRSPPTGRGCCARSSTAPSASGTCTTRSIRGPGRPCGPPQAGWPPWPCPGTAPRWSWAPTTASSRSGTQPTRTVP